MTDEPFVIDTLAKAAWAMRKYREAAQRVEINEGLAFSERTRISEWLEGVNKPFLDDMDFFAAHLEGFARKERAEGRKSVSVPDGVVQTRTKQPAFEIDKEAFIAWAKEHKPDLLRVTYAPDLKSMKANLAVAGNVAADPDTGETVPGLYVTPESIGITIKVDNTALTLEDSDDSQ